MQHKSNENEPFATTVPRLVSGCALMPSFLILPGFVMEDIAQAEATPIHIIFPNLQVKRKIKAEKIILSPQDELFVQEAQLKMINSLKEDDLWRFQATLMVSFFAALSEHTSFAVPYILLSAFTYGLSYLITKKHGEALNQTIQQNSLNKPIALHNVE